MTPDPTFYELLGVEPDATQDEVKSAFRQQAIRNHPDQGGNPTLFRMVEEAYSVLSDPDRRATYDASLRDEPTGTYATATDETQTWDSPPYQAGFDESSAPPQNKFWTSAPQGRPVFVASNGNPAKTQGIVRMIVGACVLWAIVAVLLGLQVLPGLSNSGTMFLFLTGLFMWVMGSFILRLAGWALFIYALVMAHWYDADGALTLMRVAVAFAIWLCGQWFFTFKHGDWRSIIAHSVLTKLPLSLRPDRRYIAPQQTFY